MPGDTEDILRENKLGVKKFLAYKQYLGIFIIIIFFLNTNNLMYM